MHIGFKDIARKLSVYGLEVTPKTIGYWIKLQRQKAKNSKK
ncbi:hypothetical protein [Petroclostridium sp. X23]|nr:hypothetical protein [Petroclostridium sp. X23]WHH61279.1 hypothetical protein QKW49_11475 [Petroclostridium sp. X23]